MLLLATALLLASPQQSNGFWIICDLIDAFRASERAADANRRMLERTAAADPEGAGQATQEMREAIQQAAEATQQLIEQTPGTTVNPTPPGLDDLLEGILEGILELIGANIGANRSLLTLPPPIPEGAFASQGPILTASPAAQQVNVTQPESITVDLFTVVPTDYDGSRGPAPPEFFDLPPAIYAIGTFSNAILGQFQVFEPDGTSHTYDAAQLAADLAANPESARIALPGSNFTLNTLSLVPGADPSGHQVLLLEITSVDPSTGSLSGKFVTGTVSETVVPEPSTLTLFGIGAVGLLGYAWRRKRAG